MSRPSSRLVILAGGLQGRHCSAVVEHDEERLAGVGNIVSDGSPVASGKPDKRRWLQSLAGKPRGCDQVWKDGVLAVACLGTMTAERPDRVQECRRKWPCYRRKRNDMFMISGLD